MIQIDYTMQGSGIQKDQAERDRMAWEIYKLSMGAGYESPSAAAKGAYELTDAFLAERDKQRGGK